MIDIDSDIQPSKREDVLKYLAEKYGKDHVISVGTFSTMKIASAVKDVFRVYGFKEFEKINAFTKVLTDDLSFDENIENIKENHRDLYKFYLDHKAFFDKVPYFIGKIRQTGKHAGGKVITRLPINESFPVERAGEDLVSSFPESGQESVLDDLGYLKIDLLGITILDVMANTFDMIEQSKEKLFEIEEDGVNKIVPESYLKNKGVSYE